MTSSWLASFVLIVVLLGVGALISAGVWVSLLLLSRLDNHRNQRARGASGHPA